MVFAVLPDVDLAIASGHAPVDSIMIRGTSPPRAITPVRGP